MKRIALIMGLAILIADQLTKWAALALFAGGPVAVLPFFNLVLVWNRGVSFGLFQQDSVWGPYALSALSLAICIVLYFWLRKAEHKYVALAIGAVIGGALGNVIDRLRFGAVVDFLDFHAFGWHYPAFNIADSAIVLGIAFILFDSLFLEARRKSGKKSGDNDNGQNGSHNGKSNANGLNAP